MHQRGVSRKIAHALLLARFLGPFFAQVLRSLASRAAFARLLRTCEFRLCFYQFSVYLSTCATTPTYLPALPTYLPTYLPADYLSFCLSSTWPFGRQSAPTLFAETSTCLAVSLSTHPSIYLPHLPTYLSICLSALRLSHTHSAFHASKLHTCHKIQRATIQSTAPVFHRCFMHPLFHEFLTRRYSNVVFSTVTPP